MARIVFGTYMFRYPLGGLLSCMLQWILGFKLLGHDIYVVEKSGWPGSCYDPSRQTSSDDCTFGIRVISALLARFGLGECWCYVDAEGRHHGLSRCRLAEIFSSADVFIDYGAHGHWEEESARCGVRVLVDGEPAFRQMKLELNPEVHAIAMRAYDRYFTIGQNIGTPQCPATTAGISWGHVLSPVVLELFSDDADPESALPVDAPFTTVMNWRSHDELDFHGQLFGQKDAEFSKFLQLPQLVAAPMEVAISGEAPVARLMESGWRVRRAQDVTIDFDTFVRYIKRSRGEFSVCKNVFVVTRSAWFSDRSAAYLASGRPVVMQNTGFSEHLPCGKGLFAVDTVEQARDAIEEICAEFPRHSRAARRVAAEHLAAERVLKRFLTELGV